LRPRSPSPSMLVAVLALFVALGGSSYAALHVGSRQIANNSVQSVDIRNNSVRGADIRSQAVHSTDVRDNDLRGRDIRSNTITGDDILESSLGTVPAARDAQTLAGRAPSAFLGSDRQVRSGLIKLAHGETKTIAANGPFTWKAECVDAGAGSTQLIVTVETTEAGSFAGDFGGGGGPLEPGAPATQFNQTGSTAVYAIGFPLSAVAPSGAAPVGIGFVGMGVLGADCVVNGVLWP